MMHLLEEQVPQPPDDHERELLSSYGLVTEMQFPGKPWDSIIFSLTLGVLLISILLTIHRTEKRRSDGHSGWGSLCLAGPTSGCRWSRQSNPGCSLPRRSPTLITTFQTDLS